LLVIGGLLLIDPGFTTDVIGAALGLSVAASQWFARRNALSIPLKESR
jgi:UPF0716 family protein affecting phage T7 exclusion